MCSLFVVISATNHLLPPTPTHLYPTYLSRPSINSPSASHAASSVSNCLQTYNIQTDNTHTPTHLELIASSLIYVHEAMAYNLLSSQPLSLSHSPRVSVTLAQWPSTCFRRHFLQPELALLFLSYFLFFSFCCCRSLVIPHSFFCFCVTCALRVI